MAVRVRLFATLREAAGTGVAEVPAGSVPEMLDALTSRFGQGFAQHLPACTVVVDGESVPRDHPVVVEDGAEVALLPPVSGGSAEAEETAALPFGESVASAALAAGLLAALALRSELLVAVVLIVAVVCVLDLTGLLAQAAARPVLIAAVVPAVVLPAVAAADPAAGWQRLPAFLALGLLAATGLVLVFGRRAGALDGLAATAVVGLVVGLGATSLVLLAHLPDGFRWLLALGLAVAAADVAAPAASRVRGLPQTAVTLGAPAAAVIVVGLVTALTLQPPLSMDRALMVAAAALVGTLGGKELARTAQRGETFAAAGPGFVVAAVDGLLLTAPAVYVLARAAAL